MSVIQTLQGQNGFICSEHDKQRYIIILSQLRELHPVAAKTLEQEAFPTASQLDQLENLVCLLAMRRASATAAAREADRQALEYQSETFRLQQLLDLKGIDRSDLSPYVLDNIKLRAAAASELGLWQATDTAIRTAWASLSLRRMEAEQRELQLSHERQWICRQLDSLKKRATHTAHVATDARRAQEADLSDAEFKHQAAKNWQQRCSKYLQDISGNTAKALKVGYSERLEFPALAALQERALETEKRLETAQRRLSEFHELRPNIGAADAQLRQATATLRHLHECIARKVQEIE
mmetsp:Transcript_11467/g.20711  ORF Transcript_11467/g.20711 Transcript_11467/m.20711 type:complete len:295 (-) Transcript_11467:367-1251(-)